VDPIADSFTQIKNAISARKKSLKIPHSKLKMAILEILKNNGYISDYKVISEAKFKKIEINLTGVILKIQRVSRPGRRIYSAASQIPRKRTPKGMFIVSTSEGLMSGDEARKKGVGGEVLAEIV
jgi:small subunit ribosomal protein S8